MAINTMFLSNQRQMAGKTEFAAPRYMTHARFVFSGTLYQNQYFRDNRLIFAKISMKYWYGGTVGSYEIVRQILNRYACFVQQVFGTA